MHDGTVPYLVSFPIDPTIVFVFFVLILIFLFTLVILIGISCIVPGKGGHIIEDMRRPAAKQTTRREWMR
jgi:hypothetical protein